MTVFSAFHTPVRIGSRWRLTFTCVCFLICPNVEAAVTLNCTGNSTGVINFGTVSPLQDLRYTISGSCVTSIKWVGGGYYLQVQNYSLGQGEKFSIVKTFNGLELPERGSGRHDVCLANSANCNRTINKDSRIPYEFLLTGTADATPGVHMVSAEIRASPLGSGLWTNTEQAVETLAVVYTVAHPACSLGSAPNLSLPFGTLTSDDFANSQRIAEIRLNCPSASLISAVLIPTQAAVSGSVGVSATTLDGLSIAATWADNGDPVAFNSPRTIELTKGDNLIRLGFRPKLDTRDSPAGEFSSQYTLNLTYR